jgi:hypothetical protein
VGPCTFNAFNPFNAFNASNHSENNFAPPLQNKMQMLTPLSLMWLVIGSLLLSAATAACPPGETSGAPCAGGEGPMIPTPVCGPGNIAIVYPDGEVWQPDEGDQPGEDAVPGPDGMEVVPLGATYDLEPVHCGAVRLHSNGSVEQSCLPSPELRGVHTLVTSPYVMGALYNGSGWTVAEANGTEYSGEGAVDLTATPSGVAVRSTTSWTSFSPPLPPLTCDSMPAVMCALKQQVVAETTHTFPYPELFHMNLTDFGMSDSAGAALVGDGEGVLWSKFHATVEHYSNMTPPLSLMRHPNVVAVWSPSGEVHMRAEPPHVPPPAHLNLSGLVSLEANDNGLVALTDDGQLAVWSDKGTEVVHDVESFCNTDDAVTYVQDTGETGGVGPTPWGDSRVPTRCAACGANTVSADGRGCRACPGGHWSPSGSSLCYPCTFGICDRLVATALLVGLVLFTLCVCCFCHGAGLAAPGGGDLL